MALALQPSLLSRSRWHAAPVMLYRQQPHQLLRPNHIISSSYHASQRLPIARCQPQADNRCMDENRPLLKDASQPGPVQSTEVEVSAITVAPQPEEWSEWDKVTKTQDWNDVSTEPRRNSIGIGFLTAIILGLSVVTWQLHRVISHANAEGRLPWQRDNTATASAARPSVTEQKATVPGTSTEAQSDIQDTKRNVGPTVLRRLKSQKSNAQRAEPAVTQDKDSIEPPALPENDVIAQTTATSVAETDKATKADEIKAEGSVKANDFVSKTQDSATTKDTNTEQPKTDDNIVASQHEAETQKEHSFDRKPAVSATEQTDSGSGLKALLEELTNARQELGRLQQEQKSVSQAPTQQAQTSVQKLAEDAGQQTQSPPTQQQPTTSITPSTATAAVAAMSSPSQDLDKASKQQPSTALSRLNEKLPAALLSIPGAKGSTQPRISPAPVPPISRAVDASALDSLSNDQSVSALRERLVVSLKAASAAGEASQRAAAYAAAASSAASRAAEAAETATLAASEAQGALDSATDSIVTQYEERIAKAAAAAKEAEARAAAAAAVATSYEDVARTQANISERAAAVKKSGPDSGKHGPLEQIQHFLRQAVDGVLGSHGSS